MSARTVPLPSFSFLAPSVRHIPDEISDLCGQISKRGGVEDGEELASISFPHNRIAFGLNELIVRGLRWTTRLVEAFRPPIRIGEPRERQRERERVDNSEIASESGIREARALPRPRIERTHTCLRLPSPRDLCIDANRITFPPLLLPPPLSMRREGSWKRLNRRLNSIEHPVLLEGGSRLLPNSIFPFRALVS